MSKDPLYSKGNNMKKYSSLLIALYLSFLVACSTVEYLPPVVTSWATKPTTNLSTEKPVEPKITTPTMIVTPFYTLTSTQIDLPTITPLLSPVTDKLRSYFSFVIPDIGRSYNVELKMIDVGYEKKVDTNLRLKISIQCSPGKSHCPLTIARDAFIAGFADPDPQPDKMGMFPQNLEEFQVLGYDEKMNQVENVTGKWSDIVEFEKGNLFLDEFLQRLMCY